MVSGSARADHPVEASDWNNDDFAWRILAKRSVQYLLPLHVAEIREESTADEALHLTAAMQYGGF